MSYLVYALLTPCLPMAWPIPPLDFLLLLAGWEKWPRQLLLMAWIDVLLGQPGAWWRWPLWCLWVWLIWGRVTQPAVQITSAASLGMIWYWALGPAFSWWGALAVALQSAGLIWIWLPAPQRQLKSWGWHRP